MKQTDFAVSLNRFLTDYLVNKRGSTAKTIDSYRYTFIFLLDYYNDNLHISAEQMTVRELTSMNVFWVSLIGCRLRRRTAYLQEISGRRR